MRFLRFKDLQEQDIVKDHRDLNKLIETCGFPPGRRKGPRMRIWSEAEITAWYNALPSALDTKQPLRGGIKNKVEAKRAREASQVGAS